MDLHARASAGDVDGQLTLARDCEQGGNINLARGWYARAAQAGSMAGLRGLAASLLTHVPLAVRDGVEMMRQAADGGDGEAAHVCAVIAAQDGELTGRWQVARQFLNMAMANGSALARAAHSMLPADLDAAALPPPQQRMFAQPRIEICPGFASPRECRWLIERALPRLKAAQLYDPHDGGGFRGETIRNNRDTSFELAQSDLVIALLRSRIAGWTGRDIHAMEPPMVLHYQPGQYFAPHHDALNPKLPAMAEQIRRQGQRVATVLIYLNDDYLDGETDFPELGWRFKGKAGDALCFWNVDGDGRPALRGLHAGLAPTQGEKWVFSQWVRAPA